MATCRVCTRNVKKHVNRRFHWVEENMCGLCFYGKIIGYVNSLNKGKGDSQYARAWITRQRKAGRIP